MARKERPVRIPPDLAAHSGFVKLVQFAAEHAQRVGGPWTMAFDGLELPDRPEKGRYDCEPANTTPFASTGCDGVHYSFVHVDGRVSDESPVVEISPMDSGEEFAILGADLREFIGWHVKSSRDFLKVAMSDGDMDEEEAAQKRELLDRLLAAFDAKPWGGYRSARFRELQRTFLPRLEIDLDKLPWWKRKRR